MDEQCFEWAILGKHKYRVRDNYKEHVQIYKFSGLSFPKPLNQINLFEKKSPDVYVNVYGLQKIYQQT